MIEKFPVDSEKYYREPYHGGWRVGIFRLIRAGETGGAGTERGVYTLEEGREAFMSSTTEYEAAMKLVSSWDHWKAIAKSPMNARYIDVWKEEKILSDQTKARKRLMQAADEGNVSAARTIYEAKKEEREQRERAKKQAQEEQYQNDILSKSAANIISLKARTK